MDAYHQKYADLPDREIENRLNEKRAELAKILKSVPFNIDQPIIKIAVLGCGDKRFVRGHKRIFEEIFKNKVEVTTFDISTEHLFGEEGIVKHDCTLTLPDYPYTVTYAHVLLRFIPTEKQWEVIKNSYDALDIGGIAIHVLDKEDYETKNEMLPDGYFSVPLEKWIGKLSEVKIKYQEIPTKYGLALILLK